MNATSSHIQEVTETGDPDEANQLLGNGWQLLGVFQRATQADCAPAAWALYVLGRADASSIQHDIIRVEELGETGANVALESGGVLLATIVRKDEYGDHPKFLVGRRGTAA